jgi:putative peptide zinc metalloprotease protein
MQAAAQQGFSATSLLAALRADLEIDDVGADASGALGLIVHDPMRHLYFRLPAIAARLLKHWGRRPAGDVAELAGVSLDDVKDLQQFIVASELAAPVKGSGATLIATRERRTKTLFSSAVHGYLSFKVPLFNPTRLLDGLLPFARVFVSPLMIILFAMLGLLGLYFTSRQWDQFAGTFLNFLSIEGAALYGVTLVGLKVFHELGHGLVARHYGVKVPIMGIGFMVLTPMLYTEASDAWRLKRKGQRLAIAAAGILVEAMFAAVALFAWAFLPDGSAREAAYFISVVALAGSLAVNLSPFMRFDGYHMLADFLGMYNLGPRAFALANWKLRTVFFGVDEAAPEFLPRGLTRFLIVYSYATWIYRLVLFGGIAILVYHMFPKAIGLPAALIEVFYFIIFPTIRELRNWTAMGFSKLFENMRAKISAGVLLAAIGLCFVPLDRHVVMPAVSLPAQESWIYPPEAAKVVQVAVRAGDQVRAGDLLVALENPDIEQKLKLVSLKIASNAARLQRVAADKRDLAENSILQEERQSLLEEQQGLQQRLSRLGLRAPAEGVVSMTMTGLRAGVWASPSDLLMHVRGGGAAALGLADERDALRLRLGAKAWFVSEDGVRARVSGALEAVELPGAESAVLTYLASRNGGTIVTDEKQGEGREKPLQSMLPVRFVLEGQGAAQALRGQVVVEAEARSWASAFLARVAAVALRESGF